MCGITGFISESPIRTDKYYHAHSLTKHRGPDDEGFTVAQGSNVSHCKGDDTIAYYKSLKHINEVHNAELIIGHRRLSILDLSEKGHQPYNFENLSLVYNGELFNYIEIRDELKSVGYQFETDSDTEVVLKAYHHWQEEAFNRFNGMWALAIYNAAERSLVLSRDRFGIKPLFYSFSNGVLSFASEMKFLKAFSDVNHTVNNKAINTYLNTSKTNYSSDTFWNDIQELEPARNLCFKDGTIDIKRYWDITPKPKKRPHHESLETFSQIFTDSLKLRMRSDVEVGTLLSGGLDSTTIVCSLKKLGLISGSDFKSFSAVFEEKMYSEKKYIDETVKQTAIKPHFIWPKPEEMEEHLEKLLWHIETPFRSLAVFSQYLIYKHIKENTNVKVLLNGQGADELFSGYTNHYNPYFWSLIKKGNFKKVQQEISLYRGARDISLNKVLKQLVIYSYKRPFANLNNTSYQEISSSPLREYLKYDDRTSMAFSVEARVPFLDYRLVEFAMQLSAESRIDNFSNKRIVRDYASTIIPQDILNRKDKMGFISPQERWQENELKDIITSPKRKSSTNDWTSTWRHYCLNKWLENN